MFNHLSQWKKLKIQMIFFLETIHQTLLKN